MKIVSLSPEETEITAEKLGRKLKGKEIVAFYGDLGAGKTTFVRGISKALNVHDIISSPTFTLVNEYSSDKFKIYHFDMYRIKTLEDLESTGFFDYIDTGILLIEWSENIENYLPKDTIKIKIGKNSENDNERIITIEGVHF